MADEAARVTGPTRTVSRRSWRISARPVSWMLLACTTLAILMTSIDATILASVLPFVKAHFGLDDTGAGLINSLFFVGTVAGAFFFGWLSDVVGNGYRRSWVWIIAMGLSVLGGVGTFAFASSWVAFQIMRVVMGVSRGAASPRTSRSSASGGRRRTAGSPSAPTISASPWGSSSVRPSSPSSPRRRTGARPSW